MAKLFQRAVLVVALAVLPALVWADRVLVFAAASLQTALDGIAADYTARTGQQVVVSYAGTSALARQIDRGAPADLFLSANTDWMGWLAERGRIVPDSRRDILGNRLVLIAPAPAAPEPLDHLPDLLGDGRLAVALTEAVPAGQYAKAALQSLGLWEAVANRLAEADNVRAALALVALAEAPLGIVYASDALAEPRVAVVATFPAESHPRITYQGALIRADGAAFLNHLSSDAARTVFAAHGFLRPE